MRNRTIVCRNQEKNTDQSFNIDAGWCILRIPFIWPSIYFHLSLWCVVCALFFFSLAGCIAFFSVDEFICFAGIYRSTNGPSVATRRQRWSFCTWKNYYSKQRRNECICKMKEKKKRAEHTNEKSNQRIGMFMLSMFAWFVFCIWYSNKTAVNYIINNYMRRFCFVCVSLSLALSRSQFKWWAQILFEPNARHFVHPTNENGIRSLWFRCDFEDSSVDFMHLWSYFIAFSHVRIQQIRGLSLKCIWCTVFYFLRKCQVK